MDGSFFVNAHLDRCNPILQKAWFLLQFAAQSQKKEQQNEYLLHFWESINEYYEQIAQFEGFQCGVGCSHCCFDNPHGVGTVEIHRIIPRLCAEQKKQIEAYFHEWSQLSQQHTHLRQQAWKKQGRPCPLLKEGKCSVYDVRPLACRSFFSVHNPDWCHPLHPNHQKNPQIGHDDIHYLLEKISIQRGWGKSQDLISGLYHQIKEEKP